MIVLTTLCCTAIQVVGNVDSSETSFTVRGLRAGTDYYFRVIAENGAGASPPLTMDRSFVPRTPYGKSAYFLTCLVFLLFLSLYYLGCSKCP